MQRIAATILLFVLWLTSALPVSPLSDGPDLFGNEPNSPALQETLTSEEPTTTASPEETIIPTETETPAPDETEIVTPTETMTPEGTVSPTPMETPTPIETNSPTTTIEPSPTLSITASPAWLRAGEMVTISWVIGGVIDIDPADGWILEIVLPKGVSPAQSGGNDFNPTSFTYQIELTETQGSIQLIPGQSLLDTPEFQARILEGEQIIAETKLVLETLKSVRVDKKGGEFTGLDGKIKVNFPASAIPEEIDLTILPVHDLSQFSYLLAGGKFEIVAKKAGKDEKIHKFTDQFTIEVQYNDQAIYGDESSLTLFYYDEVEKTWIPMASRVDEENNVITAMSDHLTYFSFDTQDFQEAKLPSILGFEASPFTGASNYTYPIEVPPGPGGFQPSLALTYNSQVVDEATAGSQASWAGMGWSLDIGNIERNMHGTMDEERDDTFTMTIGTSSTMLIPGADGYYHPETDNFWRIKYDAALDTWTAWDKQGMKYVFAERAMYPHIERGCYQYDLPWQWALTRIYKPGVTEPITITYYKEWKGIAYDGCGVDFNFTKAIYPAQITYPNGKYSIVFERSARTDYDTAWSSLNSLVFYQTQKLNSITIYHGSQVIRTYLLTYTGTEADSIYPKLIWPAGGRTLTLTQIQEKGLNGSTLPAMNLTYGDDMHLTSATNGYGGQVIFEYESIPWHETSSGENSTFTDAIGTYESGACDNFYPDYNEPDPETGVPPHWKPVPDDTEGWGAITGSVYCGNQHLEIVGTNAEARKLLARRFVRPGGYYNISADLGGASTQVGLVSGTWSSYSPSPAGTNSLANQWFKLPPEYTTFSVDARVKCSTCEMYKFELHMVMTHYRVTKRTLTDLVTNQSYQYTYQYGTPMTNGAAPTNAVWYYDPYSLFLGHSWVKVTDPNSQVTTTYYHQTMDLKGLPSRSRVTKASEGGEILSEVFYEYYPWTDSPHAEETTGTAFPINEVGNRFTDLDIYWPHLQKIKTRNFAGNTTIGTAAITNDNATQLGTWTGTLVEYHYKDDYGNVYAEEYSYWNGSQWEDLRVHILSYATYADGSVYLAGLISADDWCGCPDNSYYGQCYDQLQPGFPTYLEVISSTWFLYDNKPVSPRGIARTGVLTGMRTYLNTEGTTHNYRDEFFTVDTWGNRTSVSVFTQPGTYTSFATIGELVMTTSYNDAAQPGYYTYPESVTDPMGLTTTWEYDYGLGVPTKEWDPNGIPTTAVYDAFGRLTKLCKYGDDCATKPTIGLTYTDGWPFKIDIKQKMTGIEDYWLRKYYDGFGRLIEDQTLGVPIDNLGRDVTVNYAYNANGQIVAQTIPYGIPSEVNTGLYLEFGDNKTTRTTYDAFGRATQVIQPDTTTSTITYAMVSATSSGLGEPVLRTTVTDALNHSVENFQNAYGQLRKVNQGGLTATYDYYQTGLLRQVQQPGNNFTTIEYDKAGRKTSIQDPDMGKWLYTYDALGNLEKQTDGKGQVLWMKYDGDGRLTEKRMDGPTGPLITRMVYDQGAYGKGHRTSMADEWGLTTTWTYDQRGRVASETRSFQSPLGSYALNFLYNSADMVRQITYPDGEAVTVTYDENQLPATLTSSQGDVSVGNTSYDAFGRLRGVNLGNNIQPTYDYYDYDEPIIAGHTGRLQSITVGDLLRLSYMEYDAVGNPKQIKDESRDVGVQTLTFTYDALYRLDAATASGGNIPGYQFDYNYSSTSGRITSVVENGFTNTYSYGNPYHPHAVTGLTDGSAYTYDVNGNMLTRTEGEITYDQTWTIDNRLEQVKWPLGNPNHTTTYVYDGDGNRVIKIEKYPDAFGIVRETTTVYVGGLYEVQFITTNQSLTQTYADLQP